MWTEKTSWNTSEYSIYGGNINPILYFQNNNIQNRVILFYVCGNNADFNYKNVNCYLIMPNNSRKLLNMVNILRL